MRLKVSATFALALALSACATAPYTPEPLDDPTLFSSYQTRTIDAVTVSLAILTDDEARTHFGVDLGGHGVQALWLRVRNASPGRYWLIRNIIDPDLYTADEAATLARDDLADDDFEKMRQYLRDESIPVLMEPGMITMGHVYLPRQEGGRYVEVRLAADAYEAQVSLEQPAGGGDSSHKGGFSELRFDFALMLPDGHFDYEQLDTALIYAGFNLPDLDTEALRQRLETSPCCVSNRDGDRDGDPLNIVMIGEAEDVMYALSRAGWSFTHRITVDSVRRMVAAALEGKGYAVAPVSSLYAFDRKQDIALQRARPNIAQRNHMRLWLAPFTYRGRSVWIGQISRDIGIKLSAHSPSLTTHVIDPEVDLTREYLLHSLLAEGFVERFGFVRGSTEASREAPAYNLTNDPYFSDGLRLVVMLSPHPVPYTEVRSLMWEQSSAPMAEGQTEAANRNVWPIGSERIQ